MIKRNHSALAAAAAASSACLSTHPEAPPGNSRTSGFNPIVLTSDAEGGYDREIASYLKELSAHVQNEVGRASIAEWLVTKFGAQMASQAKLITEGQHTLGSGLYVIGGNAIVTASGNGVVLAVGTADVTVRGSFDVYVSDRVTLAAYDDVQIYAEGNARVRGTWGRVHGVAFGQVTGTAYDRSSWVLNDTASLDGRDNTLVEAHGCGEVRAYGRCRLVASGKTRAVLHDNAQGWFAGESTGELWGNAMAQAVDTDTVKVRGGEARLYQLIRARPQFASGNWRARA